MAVRRILASTAAGTLLAAALVAALYVVGPADKVVSRPAVELAPAHGIRRTASRTSGPLVARGLAKRPLVAQGSAQVARDFFASYLALIYGRAGMHLIDASRHLRVGLEAHRPQVLESVRARSPEIVELDVEPRSADETAALAVVDDGVLRYALLATVERRQGQLTVTRLQPWG